MYWNWSWKVQHLSHLGANLTDFGAKPTIPEITDYSANVVYFRIDGNQLTEHEKLLLLSMGVTFIL